MADYFDILKKYIPSEAIDITIRYLKEYKIHLRITKNRNSKLGDFRPPVRSGVNKVSINFDLNEYAFLITLIHETAHVYVWENYGNKPKPHGREWKDAFRELMNPILDENIFPEDIDFALRRYLRNAKASSGSDVNLSRILGKYDNSTYIVLEDLPMNAVFRINNGKTFRKLEKRRTRYMCICLDDQKNYTINPLVKVEQIK